MLKKSFLLIVLFIVSFYYSYSQVVKILFDATKAEAAGNADWVLDADQFNLGYSGGPAVLNSGNEANAQRYPSPAQSGITPSTIETYWKGGLSYWAIDCVNRNYTVETLPYNGQITYGNGSNLQDLSNYDVYIVCEPNILFTASEKTAILNFVFNGGSLFMIADHNSSDRNNDGEDSPDIWNDLMANNTVQVNPFGITFDYVDFSQTTSNIPSLPADSILHGPAGNVTQAQFSGGTSMTINLAQNASVRGVIYKTGSSFGNNNVMCAYARFGSGKVAALGDSSPCDDGTGDTNDGLYDGYIDDAAGNHRKLLMNITIWLATPNTVPAPTADFLATPLTICTGQSSTFTSSSTGTITGYSWNFGSGATPSTATTAGPHTVTYTTSGLKTISLTVSNTGGSNTMTKTNYINVNSNCQVLDVGVLSLLSPATSLCPDPGETIQVRIKNYSSTAINFSTNPVDVIVQVINPSFNTQSLTQTLNTGSLAAGSTLDVTFSSTIDLSASGDYTFNSNTNLASDANSLNNAMTPVTVTVLPGFQSDYTVVSENMGTVATTTSISVHESNNGFQNDNLTMSGTADIRTTLNSSGYATASGGANVFFTNTIGRNFIISGINTSPYNNLQLSFGMYKPGISFPSTDFLVQVSGDGINYTALTLSSMPVSQGWYYVTASGSIPAVPNLRIQFIQNNSTNQYRIDDVLLKNSSTIPEITALGPVTFCQGGSVILRASAASSYLWSTGATTQEITVASTGNFSVTETNASGCTASAPSVSVTVFPTYTITSNVTICAGSTYTLPDGNIVSTGGVYTSSFQTINGCDSIITTNLTVAVVNDNNVCTTDACNTTNGIVSHTEINTDDNNACTTDGCNSITGIYHNAISITDGNECTIDACNSVTGAISHAVINTDDGNACTVDNCNSIDGIITHVAILIDDNNPCTIDGCNSLTGVFHSPAIEICGNNLDDNCDLQIDEGCASLVLNLKIFIEGYYSGNGSMKNGFNGTNQVGLMNTSFAGLSSDPADVDTLFVTLINPLNLQPIEKSSGILKTNGQVTISFSASPGSYYLKVQHRNSIETWSGVPVFINSNTNYDFTDAINKAYGNNMIDVGSLFGSQPVYAIFSGDIADGGSAIGGIDGIQDGIVESSDYGQIENAAYFALTGYVQADVTGDGIVESSDYGLLENAAYFARVSIHP